ALEDPHHLENRSAARARRRRGDDRVCLVCAGERRALDRLVFPQIVLGDQAAVLGHLVGELLRRLTLVEFSGPVLGNPFEGLRELRLDERLADVEERAVLLEDPLRLRRAGQAARSLQRLRERVRDREALPRELDRWRETVRPRALAVFRERHLEAAD